MERYPSVPRPAMLLVSWAVEMNPKVPIPWSEDVKLGLEIYPGTAPANSSEYIKFPSTSPNFQFAPAIVVTFK